jgi:hypothetical protein
MRGGNCTWCCAQGDMCEKDEGYTCSPPCLIFLWDWVNVLSMVDLFNFLFLLVRFILFECANTSRRYRIWTSTTIMARPTFALMLDWCISLASTHTLILQLVHASKFASLHGLVKRRVVCGMSGRVLGYASCLDTLWAYHFIKVISVVCLSNPTLFLLLSTSSATPTKSLTFAFIHQKVRVARSRSRVRWP